MTDTREPAAAPAEPAESPEGGTTRLGWALLLISVAQLMVVLDATIANIALPFIQSDLDISQANLQWVVTGYALAFGGLLLLGGRLGDLYGRRRVFIVGVAIFAIASGVGGLAANEPMLLASRGLQGLGAALAWRLAPNPVAGSALVSGPAASGPLAWRILDAAGRTVRTGQWAGTPSGAYRLDASGLAAGAYHLLLQAPDGAVELPFIKQ